MAHRTLLRPDRIRTLKRPFSWLPFSLIGSGLFARLSCEAKALYTFLCLVADRDGLSFYGEARLLAHSGLCRSDLYKARDELCAADLLAFDGRTYQVLSLPDAPTNRGALRQPVSTPAPESITTHPNHPTQEPEAAPLSATQLKANVKALMKTLTR